jgi:glyoxylase-like metal-dependent hydrolase (beta-lactamase superfamily II)
MALTTANILCDGTFKVDGGALYGQLSKMVWETMTPTDRKNRVTLGLNCWLLRIAEKWILVDTGVGSNHDERDREHYGLGTNRLFKELKLANLTPKDIDIVILTHMQFEHSGGATRMDRTGAIVPTFSRATYMVQRDSWEEAQKPSERGKFAYRADYFMPVAERGQLELLDGDTEILPGLQVIECDGPARGHQLVLFNHGGERLVIMGDLVPTPFHLNLPVISAFDYSPQNSLEQKREILTDAEKYGWLLGFSHGHDVKSGYLERRGEMAYITPVDLTARGRG